MRKQKISAKYVFSWNFPVWRIFPIVGWNRLQHNAFNWYVKSLLVKSYKFKRNFKFMGPFLHFLPFLIKLWILSSPRLFLYFYAEKNYWNHTMHLLSDGEKLNPQSGSRTIMNCARPALRNVSTDPWSQFYISN